MKYSHAYTIAFTVTTEHAVEDVTERELLNGLHERLVDMKKTGEIKEAVGEPFDTDILEEEDEIQHEKDGDKPRLHGNLASIILQRAYHNGGEPEVFKVAKECLSGLSADEIMAIAKNDAWLDGNNIDGLTFRRK